jgi:hypothetical protein
MSAAMAFDIEGSALAYAARGWSVVPIEPAGKRPLAAWLPFQQRIATREEIVRWYRHWPRANVGIVTGAVSGLVVLDVDPHHGGADSLDGLFARHGGLQPTVEVVTGGGGCHLYFSHPGGTIHNKAGLLPGVDFRGDGGCVVAPPSLHVSGKRYAWRPGHGPDELPLALLPAWLPSRAHDDDGRTSHGREHWRALVREGVRAGARNSTIASFAGHLLWHGVDAEVVCELLLAWNRWRCHPPLPDEEVARTVTSIVRRHERENGGIVEGTAIGAN